MPPSAPSSPLALFFLRYPLFILIALAIAGAAVWNWTTAQAPDGHGSEVTQPPISGEEGKSPVPPIAPWDNAGLPLAERFSAALAAGKVDVARDLVDRRMTGSPATRVGRFLPPLVRAAANGDVYAMTSAFHDPRFENLDIKVALRSFPTNPRYIETKPRSKKPAYE
jgi:hypothetical protein